MKPWLNLDKRDMEHLKENNMRTKKEFLGMRERQKLTAGDKFPQEPCWDCRLIEKKLNQVVKLFDLPQFSEFRFTEKGKIWTVETPNVKFMWLHSENGAQRYLTRKDNKNVIKVER